MSIAALVLATSLIPLPVGPVDNAKPPAAAPRLSGDPHAALHALRRTASPKVNAMVLATLRRFADGAATRTPVDDAVARRLGRIPGAKAAAKRIVARIDALPPRIKAKAFAEHSTSEGVTGPLWTSAVAEGAGLVNGGLGITPATEMPSENPQFPSAFDVELTGVHASAATDADGSDELVVLTSFARVIGANAYSIQTTELPSGGALEGLGAGTTSAQSTSVYDVAGSTDAIAVTVAFEADGDTAAQRSEYHVMLGLAESLALNAEGAASLEDFAYGFDYTMGMLQLSDPADWPSGSLQRTILSGPTALHQLWATPASNEHGIAWKFRHDHVLGGATYSVYFDVPSPAAAMPTIRVDVLGAASLDGVDAPDQDDLRVVVEIAGHELTKNLAKDDDTPSVSWGVQRRVLAQPRTIRIQLVDASPGPPVGFTTSPMGVPTICGGGYPPCPPILTPLVLKGASDTALDLTFDPATGALSGDATADPATPITFIGSGGKRGKVKVKVKAIAP